MLLSDGEIQLALNIGELTIDPLPDSSSFQPASVDLRLDSIIRVHQSGTSGMSLDPMQLDVDNYINRYTEKVDIGSTNGYDLTPGSFIIGSTVETVSLSNRLSGRVEGRSRLARLGIGVHITAPKSIPGSITESLLRYFTLAMPT